ncbi:MAG: hypothetical protein II328_04260 [Clostridia bacterium]|nr:hypothetical protein [Clostridia bacterium]
MDPNLPIEQTTYDEHKKKASRSALILTLSLFLVVLILGSLFLYVACSYNATDAAFILKDEDVFSEADGFLFPRGDDYVTEGNYVATYNLNTGDLTKFPVESFDLSRVGLTGTYRYFRHVPPISDLTASDEETTATKGRIVSAYFGDVALSRANTENVFVCKDEDGKKWRVDTVKSKSAPLFEGSTADGVDVYGTNIQQFSHNGLYAVGQNKGELLIYIRESEASFAVTKVVRVDLSPYGTLDGYDFASESYLRLAFYNPELETFPENEILSYYLCDVRTGEVVPCPKVEGAQNTVQFQYGQYAPVTVGEEKEEVFYRYADVLRGKVFSHKLPFDANGFTYPCAISQYGEYAAIRHSENVEEKATVLFSKAGGRQFTSEFFYEEILDEGDTIEHDRIEFLTENIVLAAVTRSDGTNYSIIFKICF